MTNAGYRFTQHVFVQAKVVDVATGSEQHTNDFKFTWCEQEGEPLHRMVVPQTYAGVWFLNELALYLLMTCATEAMAWVEGRRALEYGAEIRSLRNPW